MGGKIPPGRRTVDAAQHKSNYYSKSDVYMTGAWRNLDRWHDWPVLRFPDKTWRGTAAAPPGRGHGPGATAPKRARALRLPARRSRHPGAIAPKFSVAPCSRGPA